MTNIVEPVGRWWLAYDDGAVWPCDVLSVNHFAVTVRPVHPAPDAGVERAVAPSRVYDSKFNRPRRVARLNQRKE
jgi:hypothetical protein